MTILCGHMLQAFTPVQSPTKRIANSSTTAVLEMLTARNNIADCTTSVLFAVIDNCPEDLMLKITFRTLHLALIDWLMIYVWQSCNAVLTMPQTSSAFGAANSFACRLKLQFTCP